MYLLMFSNLLLKKLKVRNWWKQKKLVNIGPLSPHYCFKIFTKPTLFSSWAFGQCGQWWFSFPMTSIGNNLWPSPPQGYQYFNYWGFLCIYYFHGYKSITKYYFFSKIWDYEFHLFDLIKYRVEWFEKGWVHISLWFQSSV
jgi:hypothetical protein